MQNRCAQTRCEAFLLSFYLFICILCAIEAHFCQEMDEESDMKSQKYEIKCDFEISVTSYLFKLGIIGICFYLLFLFVDRFKCFSCVNQSEAVF